VTRGPTRTVTTSRSSLPKILSLRARVTLVTKVTLDTAWLAWNLEKMCRSNTMKLTTRPIWRSLSHGYLPKASPVVVTPRRRPSQSMIYHHLRRSWRSKKKRLSRCLQSMTKPSPTTKERRERRSALLPESRLFPTGAHPQSTRYFRKSTLPGVTSTVAGIETRTTYMLQMSKNSFHSLSSVGQALGTVFGMNSTLNQQLLPSAADHDDLRITPTAWNKGVIIPRC
jgi:hypothetical protein